MEFEELKKKIEEGAIEAQLRGVEFKSSWKQDHGRDISAIANDENLDKGWLIVGINDDGTLAGCNLDW